MISGVVRGVVVLGAADKGPFKTAACWPTKSDQLGYLLATVQAALAKRCSVIQNQPAAAENNPAARQHVACPLLIDGRLSGVVALEIESRPEPQQHTVLQLLQWGAACLGILIRQEALATNDRLVTALNLITTSLTQPRFQAAATAVATELATQLACERVSFGFLKGQRMRLEALSHSARFDRKTNRIQAIEAAMTEALDQDSRIVYPVDPDAPFVSYAHGKLSQFDSSALCTVPFAENGHLLGAITLERAIDQPFDSATVELLETVAALVGPLLETKRREDRGLLSKIWQALGTQWGKLVGPHHSGYKLTALLLSAMLAFLMFAEGDYRITARASLEGAVQRAMVAPLDGYVAKANVRAGDVVQQGEQLFKLDDRDLQLERLKWVSQREQFLRQYRDALAQGERAQVRIVKARLDQAKAQLALVDEQLARIQGVAPFDGVVVSGDLSQSLGAPVQRGQVLFEIAPLEQYRLVLQVDERDMGALANDQPGKLVLASGARERLAFTVAKITPVSAVVEGRNTFRIEAQLSDTPKILRPGMEGIGKITIGPRKLVWIWTHSLTEWLRLRLWSWWP
jgi:multidrug resistance efflux pump/putative methionine-R-sulfoxide reductase with GAF domain